MNPEEKTRLDQLQRALLRLLRREHGLSTAFFTLEGPCYVNTSIHGCAELRDKILTIDPTACIYATWGGDWPVDWTPSDASRPWRPWVKQRRQSTFADSIPLELTP
jgi:hypothetical protein